MMPIQNIIDIENKRWWCMNTNFLYKKYKEMIINKCKNIIAIKSLKHIHYIYIAYKYMCVTYTTE